MIIQKWNLNLQLSGYKFMDCQYTSTFVKVVSGCTDQALWCYSQCISSWLSAVWSFSETKLDKSWEYRKGTHESLFLFFLCFFYLCCVHLIEHYNGRAVVVEHQPPEVTHGVWQRMLGDNEGRWLFVALECWDGPEIINNSKHKINRQVKSTLLIVQDIIGNFKKYL